MSPNPDISLLLALIRTKKLCIVVPSNAHQSFSCFNGHIFTPRDELRMLWLFESRNFFRIPLLIFNGFNKPGAFANQKHRLGLGLLILRTLRFNNNIDDRGRWSARPPSLTSLSIIVVSEQGGLLLPSKLPGCDQQQVAAVLHEVLLQLMDCLT